MQPVTARFAADGGGVEKGTFQEHVGRSFSDARVIPAHDAGQSERTLVVGDNQGIGTQLQRFTVEQGQLLALARHAHADTAVEPGQVEPVHGLPEFQKNIVGHVNHRTQAADAASAQPLHHPQRRPRRRVDALHHAADVAWAGLWRVHVHRDAVVDDRRHGVDGRFGHIRVVQYAELARQAGDTEAIAAVGGQVDVDALIVELEIVPEVFAQRRILRQRHDAGRAFRKPQFGS